MNKTMKLVHAAQLSDNREELLNFFEKVGDLGDIIVYKMDGLRESNKYTVLISSGSMIFETIRCDGSSLADAITKSIVEYEKVRQDFR
jgi:DNA-binding transcriptional regulator WhiA